VAARTLRREGYRVFEAGDADEALMLVSRDPSVADLLVTDVVMPGLSGVELASCIVAARPDVRVLFSSGASGMAHGDSARLPRGAAFLPKPFTPKALADRVRGMFGL
jgi:DNA-binding response OmpR family regulator